jgi:hypothetical protein
MQRSKFPYTARSSAKVIRHAVSIDERRAKFRQDLISGGHQKADHIQPQLHRYESDLSQMNEKVGHQGTNGHHSTQQDPKAATSDSTGGHLSVPAQNLPQSSSESLARPMQSASTEHLRERPKSPRKHARRTYSQAQRPQDIQEVW